MFDTLKIRSRDSSCMDIGAEAVVAHPAALLRLRPGAKLVVLTDPRRAVFFRAQAPDAMVLTDVASLDGIEARFDAAILDGLLEDERWDRWVLQRVHRALCMDAPIVVLVPPLLSLASATDLPFLAYATRQVLRQLMQRWSEFELPSRVRRRYGLGRLVRKMESVGYTAVELGLGWPRRPRRLALTARKGSSVAGFRRHGWRDAELHGKSFAEQYPDMPAARESWLSSFPELRTLEARSLEPAKWRDARVLVLAPHPDDELLGCGGTLCRLLAAGARVSILQATDGCKLESLRDLPPARRKTVRLEEAQRVASALRADVVLWRHEDARLRCSGATIAQLSRLLDELRPTHVFTPFLGDRHDDHRTLSRILGAALGIARVEPQVLQYEVWGLVPANLYCDVTDYAETVERLLFLYERAMQVDDFVHLWASRNLARALELTGRPAYVEAFLCTAGADYRRLVERTA